jgi:hypothetical protein
MSPHLSLPDDLRFGSRRRDGRFLLPTRKTKPLVMEQSAFGVSGEDSSHFREASSE